MVRTKFGLIFNFFFFFGPAGSIYRRRLSTVAFGQFYDAKALLHSFAWRCYDKLNFLGKFALAQTRVTSPHCIFCTHMRNHTPMCRIPTFWERWVTCLTAGLVWNFLHHTTGSGAPWLVPPSLAQSSRPLSESKRPSNEQMLSAAWQ